MSAIEQGLIIGYGSLFTLAIYVWFRLTKALRLFRFKLMQKIFYLMLISETYVTLWLFAELLLRLMGVMESNIFDVFPLVSVALLLCVYLLIVQTLEAHRNELTKYDSMYYRT
ncbi:hypothetical protein KJ765_02495 [Candidatus Micrarchaeota archaeon]|nr:hypothetical protein [Candidatus Micrarchaeota archaeon]